MYIDIKKTIGVALYKIIGSNLPPAHFIVYPIGRLSKKIRQLSGILVLEKCGKNVNIYPKAQFSSLVELGDNSDIGWRSRLNGKVIIGKDVIMGPEVLIYTRNHNSNSIDRPIKYQGTSSEMPVTIGDGCWICARAIILPGVTIGKNSIIAAGAVVTKDVPDNVVVAGNPAQIVKYRVKSEYSESN